MTSVKSKRLTAGLLLLALALTGCWYTDMGQSSVEPVSTVSQVSEASEESVDEQAERYMAAEQLEELGNYEDAARVFASLGSYADAAERSKACYDKQNEEDYNTACALYADRQYAEAEEYFSYLGDYRDSADYVEKCKKGVSREQFWSLLAVYENGDVLSFGRMEQDGDPEIGAEELEWIVLGKDEDRILVLSKNVLDSMPLFDSLPDAEPDPEVWAWQRSIPASWLNGAFLEDAFTAEEREMMELGSDPDADGSAGFLRLLTREEAAGLTAGFLQIGEQDPDGTYEAPSAVSWWLMPDPSDTGASPVIGPGGEQSEEPLKWTEPCGVRPLFWIGH